MDISNLTTDEAVLAELGHRLTQRRIDAGLTQADLADQAGVGKRTVERIEAGQSAQMTSLVRIFRVLDLLATLDELLPATGPGPIDQLRHQGRRPQRVSKRREKSTNDDWTWGEES
jgi:transcriptional regulator with XRE-family HTH domain